MCIWFKKKKKKACFPVSSLGIPFCDISPVKSHLHYKSFDFRLRCMTAISVTFLFLG